MIMVTAKEQDLATRWLAKHGQPVGRPTPLTTALIATRQPVSGGGMLRYLGYSVLAVLCGVGYWRLFGRGTTGGAPLFFVYFALQLAMWDGVRLRQRNLRDSIDPMPGVAREPWWKVLGGWYIASLVLAFGGGAALAVTIDLTTSFRTYALSWLGLLALSALICGWVLTGVLRSPVLAEDAGSLAVWRAVLAEKIYVATPVLAVVPVVFDLLVDRGQPPGFTPWLTGYVAAVTVGQAVSCVLHWRRHRKLPPGDYGEPVAPDRRAPVDWSPPA